MILRALAHVLHQAWPKVKKGRARVPTDAWPAVLRADERTAQGEMKGSAIGDAQQEGMGRRSLNGGEREEDCGGKMDGKMDGKMGKTTGGGGLLYLGT